MAILLQSGREESFIHVGKISSILPTIKRAAVPSRSANEFPDACCLLCADSLNLGKGGCVDGEDTFERPKVREQSLRQGRTDSRQPLQYEEPPRCRSFGLPVESTQNLLLWLADLIGEERQHHTSASKSPRTENSYPSRPSGRRSRA